ncbi:MAG TPA: MBL fold metallo-hydrolase [Ignavibacteriaceae bacterium]|nr:MBL fold metallo-hydrolase [Ignavibacteriaceae bacterium]
MFVVKKFIFNPFSENTYLLWDENSKDALVVDPGCSSTHEENEIKEFAEKNSLNVKYMVNTHCHIDHLFGCRFIKETFNAEYYIPAEEKILLKNSETQSSLFGMKIKKPPEPDNFITPGTMLKKPFDKIKFLHTPGHTEGEYCLYFQDELFCITGDVLFKGSIGRTDLWGGDYNSLINSIKYKLFTLPDEVIIYPGHGENSTIGTEKKENPFLAELNIK